MRRDIANVSIVGDVAIGRRFLPAARKMLNRLQQRLDAGGVPSGGDHGPLSDDVYCYARIAGGVATIEIHANPLAPPGAEPEKIDRLTIPDFLSGAGLDNSIDGGLLKSFLPTRECAIAFGMPMVPQPVKRLAITPHERLRDQLENRRPPPVLAQSARLRPTLYSGTMKRLVQMLLGYGKQAKKSIYGRELVLRPDETFDPPPTKFERDTAKNGLQVPYDWRWHRTHGLTRAQDGRWWIVEVRSGVGIHAMPMRRHLGSITEEFRKKAEDKADGFTLEVLDLFGGLPTGEPFPSGEELDAKVRAGMILRGADADDVAQFYSHSPYSTMLGWAFSDSGRKATNTAWRYGGDRVQRGVHFGIDLNVGAVREIKPPANADALKRRIASKAREFPRRIEAALFKIDLLTDDQVSDLMRAQIDDAFGELDKMVVDPVAVFSAAIGKHSEGKVYWPTIFSPQIKFPTLGGDILSHDMTPLNPLIPVSGEQYCDTVMHAFFSGEQLRVVKFYKGPTDNRSGEENDFEQCMNKGSWFSRTFSGQYGVQPGFYTETFDDRQETWENLTESRIKGDDLGYVRVAFGDSPENLEASFMFRERGFRITTSTTSWTDRRYGAAIAIPCWFREAYYYAVRDSYGSVSRSKTVFYRNVRDPWSYLGWRNFFNIQGRQHPAGCGSPSVRRVSAGGYSPGLCSDDADNGPWATICQQIEPMAYSISLPNIPGEIEPPKSKASLTVHLVCSGKETPILTYNEVREGQDSWFLGYRWFRPSPDPEGGDPDRIQATGTVLGTGDAVVYARNINDGINALHGLPNSPSYINNGVTFMGVVNVDSV
jgi:hypothetical protein